MKMKKILIIGLGNMGLSHLKSFLKKKYIIHIVEKNININIKNLRNNKLLNKKIFIFKKIPDNYKYLLTISATQSGERHKLLKNFFKSNKTKFLLLEKFCFPTMRQFNAFNNNFSNKTKTFVNSWGYIVAKKIKNKKKLQNFRLVCKVKEGLLSGCITHLFHIYDFLNNNSNIIKLDKKKLYLIKNERRINYDELAGAIEVKDLKQNEMKIETIKNLKNLITINIYQKNKKIHYKIIFKKNNTIKFYEQDGKTKEIRFPFSKITTSIFLKNCLNRNYKFMPSFRNDFEISKLILENFKVRIL